MTAELEALAVRCEQASGPDRFLAREVLLACKKGYVSPLYRWLDPTASTDAALSLIPSGWMFIISDDPETGQKMAGLFHDNHADCCGSSTALPNAIIAAALRARASAAVVIGGVE